MSIMCTVVAPNHKPIGISKFSIVIDRIAECNLTTKHLQGIGWHCSIEFMKVDFDSSLQRLSEILR